MRLGDGMLRHLTGCCGIMWMAGEPIPGDDKQPVRKASGVITSPGDSPEARSFAKRLFCLGG